MNYQKLESFIIISAESTNNSKKQNTINTDLLENELLSLDFDFKLVVGYWEGVSEFSFLVISEDIDLLKNIAKKYQQEAILFVNSCRKATVFYTAGGFDDIGQFNNISEYEAKNSENYTYCPTHNAYYKAG